MTLIRALSWLLGIDDVAAIAGARLSLAAPWVQNGVFWLVLLATVAIAGAVLFYTRAQSPGSHTGRMTLGFCRGGLLALVLFMLSDPILELTVVSQQRPRVFLVLDDTESMAIADELPSGERKAIENAVGWNQKTSRIPTRTAYVRSLLAREQNNWLARLTGKNVELEAYLFEGQTTSQLRKLEIARPGRQRLDPAHVASQLSATGQVTALGAVLEQLGEQSSHRPDAVVLISDFVHNAGPPPTGTTLSPAMRLAVPLYTVGVGAREAIDLAVDLQIDPKLKKAERSSLTVKLRHSGLTGQSASVQLTARRLGGERTSAQVIGQRTMTMQSELETLEFPFTPDEAGPFEFTALAEPLAGEATEHNNQAARQVNIVDDYLRLMYVAHEPTWEWRFVKEVFHRDKLVGMEGFRTFLSSSDPEVRENNILFLPTLTPKRSDFFATDVLILDDAPASLLTDRFTALVKEYVGNLGGGLIVLAGPRFGPRELYRSEMADMLPVIVDPQAQLRTAPDSPEFHPRLTPEAGRYLFMQLDLDERANSRAWENLGKLPWYQPVSIVHPQAEVLAEHPTDRCSDGKTPQPLIAIRKYGKGEVVYLAFNEMWRLRRQYGEKYYRQFWSQLIYRLGMSHALGPDKRFVVRLDQQQYRAGDKVTLSVEAYDENYEPLSEKQAAAQGLKAELILPAAAGASTRPLAIPPVRTALYETRIPVDSVGQYSLRVIDPITGNAVEQRFEVTTLSIERQRAVRDEKLQTSLAEATGGRSYDLTNVHRLPDELDVKPRERRHVRNIALWATPLWFATIVALMLGEWAARKLLRLP